MFPSFCLATFLGLLSSTKAVSLPPRQTLKANATVTLEGPPTLPQDASVYLDPSLASFSIEPAFFEVFFGNSSNPDQFSLGLIRALEKRTGRPPQIRIGGITADSSTYHPEQAATLVNTVESNGALSATAYGSNFFSSAAETLPKGTKWILNLNLRQGNYTGAAIMAKAARQAFGEDLIGLELGNEPDHYGTFTVDSYTQMWKNWSSALTIEDNLPKPYFQLGATAEDPFWPFDTDAANAQLNCASTIRAGANDDGVVITCAMHTYQYSVCDPARAAVATLENFVNHTRIAMYLDLWQPQIKITRETLGRDFGEFSSVSCSGKNSVSNSFGQAIWLLDTALYAASINVSRIYPHQGGPLAQQSNNQENRGGLSFYDMWWPVDNLNGPKQVLPSYSGYLLLAEALGFDAASSRVANIYPGRQANNSGITTAGGDTTQGTVVVYGLWDDKVYSGERPNRLVVINSAFFNSSASDQSTRPVQTVDISAYTDGSRDVRLCRLTAPGTNVLLANVTTYAGRTYALGGEGEGELVEETVEDGVVSLFASEAALVWL